MSAQQLLSTPSFYSHVLPNHVLLTLQANTNNQTFAWSQLGLGYGAYEPKAVVAINNDRTYATYGISVVQYDSTSVVLKQIVPTGLSAEAIQISLIIFSN